jgi:PE family
MSQPLNVLPEELIRVSGLLSVSQSAATGSVTGAAGTAVPVPAGADPVSGAAAVSFAQYVPVFLHAAADGLVKLEEAAQRLVPIAEDYTATDADNGAKVSAQGAEFV